ncbi:unnamed protein product [Urochloa decumbens]|uniref:RING-type domain-containing protein n=1 Tax=Urochloa decumbens TaxID=240449 RepID=A0ABC9DU53_9POAL
MVIMAGMLPGVECARRRRLRPGGAGAGAEASGGTRRPSFCLYAAGHGSGGHPAAAHGGAGSSAGKRSGVMEMIHEWTLDSNAREAKERLDQKLRSNREAAIKRHHSTGSIKLSRPHHHHGAAAAEERGESSASAASAMCGVQREVYSKKGVMRRLMRWSRPRWAAAEQAECAVCLDEFRAGDVLAHLPCGHRFHWACAAPWLEGTSRCPFCRAAVDQHAGGGA